MATRGTEALTIRAMDLDALHLAIDWAAEEGWNPGLFDAQSFYRADPQGFLMAYLGDEPIASISAVKYPEGFGFIGFYIVKPEHRGKGYGLALWQAGMAYLNDCNIGLDGVVEQQANYQKSGFALAYANIRFQGQAPLKAPDADTEIKPISAFNQAEVLAYDKACFGSSREGFLSAWLAQEKSLALGILHQGTLAGFGVVRPCRHGYKIGPLFADGAVQAEQLLLALVDTLPAGSEFFWDVPEVNPEGVSLAAKYKMDKVFETARMYTREKPPIALDRVFGVTSFELG